MPRASTSPTTRSGTRWPTCWARPSARLEAEAKGLSGHALRTASAQAAKQRRTLFNAWLTLNNPFLIELIGEAGWDCLTIDQQHGLGGNEALLGCLTAARACGLPAIVRVAENDPGLIGRALDAGAQGIMCPLIADVEGRRCLRAVREIPAAGLSELGPLPRATRL